MIVKGLIFLFALLKLQLRFNAFIQKIDFLQSKTHKLSGIFEKMRFLRCPVMLLIKVHQDKYQKIVFIEGKWKPEKAVDAIIEME
jgi:hypothetical protein